MIQIASLDAVAAFRLAKSRHQQGVDCSQQPHHNGVWQIRTHQSRGWRRRHGQVARKAGKDCKRPHAWDGLKTKLLAVGSTVEKIIANPSAIEAPPQEKTRAMVSCECACAWGWWWGSSQPSSDCDQPDNRRFLQVKWQDAVRIGCGKKACPRSGGQVLKFGQRAKAYALKKSCQVRDEVIVLGPALQSSLMATSYYVQSVTSQTVEVSRSQNRAATWKS